jgi:hypothetical protein
MPVPIRIVTIHEEHPDLVRRELHEVTRTAMYAMGRTWAVDLLPEHFEPGAGRIFNYQPRQAKYLRKKNMQFELGLRATTGQPVVGSGGQDLVYTGRLRDALLRTAKNLVRAFPSRVNIDLVGTEYFTDRPRNLARPNLAKEVRIVSPRHERILGEAADRGFETALRAVRRARRARKVTITGRRAA